MLGIKLKNYKCFGEEAQGFDDIKKINIIFGKNNSGKSALLDAIRIAKKASLLNQEEIKDHNNNRENKSQYIQFKYYKPEESLKNIIKYLEGLIKNNKNPKAATSVLSAFSEIDPNSDIKFEISIIEENITWLEWQSPAGLFKKITFEKENLFRQCIIGYLHNPLPGYNNIFTFSSDRRIEAEHLPTDEIYRFNGNGKFISSYFHYISNSPSLEIQQRIKIMCSNINSVLRDPSFEIKDIRTRRQTEQLSSPWEIHIETNHNPSLPLSKIGQGIQTLLLFFNHLSNIKMNQIENTPPHKSIIIIEEPELNMHPDLQRNFMDAIYKIANHAEIIFFITTHSSTIIDYFSNKEHTQFLHIERTGNSSTVKTVDLRTGKSSICEDLGIKASDAFFCNVSLWVEGPSDLIYFERWIRLASNDQLQRGVHYQVFMYGGSNLAHYTGDEALSKLNQLLPLTTASAGSIVIMDSDKTDKNAIVASRKLEIRKQVESNHGIAWILDARMIECYVSEKSIQAINPNTTLPSLEQLKYYSQPQIINYINKQTQKPKAIPTKKNPTRIVTPKRKYRKLQFKEDKIEWAHQITPHIQKEHLTQFDLPKKLNEICRYIGERNGFSADEMKDWKLPEEQ